MRSIVFLLEERSAIALLQGVIPRLLPDDVAVYFLAFEGKQDLHKNIARKLKAWRAPNTKFVVLRDQDGGDCNKVKSDLVDEIRRSGKEALCRVACRQLEAWIVGDLVSFAKAFERPNLAAHASKEKFRDPDALGCPVDELRLLVPDYQKIDGARRLGLLLDPRTNSSKSFRVFCAGVKALWP